MVFQRKIPNKKNQASKRFHYTRKNGKWKPKHPFDCQEDADEFIVKHKMGEKGYASYLCPLCGKWHIGKKQDG